VCCSLADGFFAALQTVRAVDPPVDHVLVEASGVADPGQVAQWGHTPGFRLDGVVVVADADAVVALAADAYVGDTVRAQLRAADLVLVTKLDLVDDGGPVRAWIATVTDAPVVDAPHGRVPLAVLVGTATAVDPPLEPAPHPAYVTASVESDAVVDPATLASALTDRPAGLLRAKGIVRVADAPDRQSVVQVVGRRQDVRPGDPWPPDARSRMVGIARPPTTRDELAGWLHHLVGRSAP
jgi:G3E family GTPase